MGYTWAVFIGKINENENDDDDGSGLLMLMVIHGY